MKRKRARTENSPNPPPDVTPNGDGDDDGEGENDITSQNSLVLDALPYADAFGPGDREAAMALIQQEMTLFKPRDYLSHLPPIPTPTFGNSPSLNAEWTRLQNGLPMTPLDTRRYALSFPSNPNPETASVALSNSQAQLEHQHLRTTNLSLLSEYGANAWLTYNRTLEASQKDLNDQLNEVKKKIEETNRMRKAEQLAAGKQESDTRVRWTEAVYRNIATDAACRRLEAEIELLRERI